ncbi:hypothetical protein AX16_005618 [Volvariella volvacea WC 439]|nr:hypothetical protein AX16_005618 [Volvariella volvacea WC 439]
MLNTGTNSSTSTQPPSPKIPSPPYKEDHASQVIVAETTTTRTEIVTTTTTTHFFSLPLWRKRGRPSTPSRPHSSYEQNALSFAPSEDGTLTSRTPPRMRSFATEKDLPPTPYDSEIGGFGSSRLKSARSDSKRPSTSPSNKPRPSLQGLSSYPGTPSQSAAALAQTALGLGLTPVVPSASSSSSEVNTVAFGTVPNEHASPSPTPLVRKTKSSLKLLSSAILSSDANVSEDDRRRRGISFGPASLLSFGHADKGKAKETATEHSTRSPNKGLTRRSSFWSRKKSTTTAPDNRQQHPNTLSPSLPRVQPISPFHVDLEFAHPASVNQSSRPGTHTRGLSRSLSERTTAGRLRPSKSVSSHRERPTPDSPTMVYLSPPISPFNSTQSASAARPRAQTNPPLLRRLSMNVLSHNILLPSTSKSRGATPITITPSSSTRPSMERLVSLPKPLEQGDSPTLYLNRLMSAVSKAEIAGVLASSSDPFHVQALQTYLDRFDFVQDPLDIALRKLLMHVGLPKETQQIDRVIEAFATRYSKCNPGLFTSDDHPYILAFSLIMLHTDAFNKSNKRKMTKADYIKNTRLPGISPEVLDCFYDNIVFAPFIFIEDPVDVNGQRGLTTESNSSRNISPASSPSVGQTNSLLAKGNKVDPYHLIANNLLNNLRVNVAAYIPLENPYFYEGTSGPWDQVELHRAFARATIVEVGYPELAKMTPFFGLAAGGAPPSPVVSTLPPMPEPNAMTTRDAFALKLTKAGVMQRKDDLVEGGKRASNRKWRTLSLLLTGSQLLFFRDPNWAATVLEYASQRKEASRPVFFRPDELISLKDAIAVYDASYTKACCKLIPFTRNSSLWQHDFTLRFVVSDGRQMLLRADNENELNEWISRINYASAFKTAGIRMRPVGMTGKDVQLTGIAAATSHLHDLQLKASSKATPKGHKWDRHASQNLAGVHSPETTLQNLPNSTELDVPVAPEIDGADQFKATFDQVKADLAARWSLAGEDAPSPEQLPTAPGASQTSSLNRNAGPSFPARIHILEGKIQDLTSRIAASQTQLESDVRLLRNFDTLTPFQRATRERLIIAIQNAAKRMNQVRLEITKLTCHRDVLSKDMISERQTWERAREVALKAALDTLRSRNHHGSHHVPIADSSTQSGISESHPSTENDAEYHASMDDRESSICESFHSALDFSEEWPFFEAPSSLNKLSNDDSLESRTSQHPGPNSVAFPSDLSARTSFDSHAHERYYTPLEDGPEQAEEWHRTRCAQRVSLVRLPSNIGLSTQFGRHRT